MSLLKSNAKKTPDPIDFVIPWVDGSDPAWQAEKRCCEEKTESAFEKKWTNGDSRYRDWDLLRYWFRGVEKYAPWVNQIWFITWGHLPPWLDTEHPGLRIVNHRDYIPEIYLPTFSSHTIELNMHRIQGLAEHFVYFNDDMFLTAPVSRTDFFKNGRPCDSAVLTPVLMTQNGIRAEINNLYVINDCFEKKKVIREHPGRWFSPRYGRMLIRTLLMMPFSHFSGFYVFHLPCSYRKQTLKDVWEAVPEILDETCRHRFRSTTDVNQWLFEYWQYCTDFEPRSCKIGSYHEGMDRFEDLCREITGQRYKIVCCNDSPDVVRFEEAKERLKASFDRILGEKSSFELF